MFFISLNYIHKLLYISELKEQSTGQKKQLERKFILSFYEFMIENLIQDLGFIRISIVPQQHLILKTNSKILNCNMPKILQYDFQTAKIRFVNSYEVDNILFHYIQFKKYLNLFYCYQIYLI